MTRGSTMADVAAAAGVSRALVSLAYRGASGVSAPTRSRILAIGEELGYQPNLAAARLAGRGGDTIGVFLQDLRNDVFADIHEGLRQGVEAAGRHLVLSVGTIDGRADATALDTLRQRRVDVVVAAGLQLPDDEVRAVAGRVPVVSVARVVEAVDAVASDDRAGAALAVDHLLRLGHTRIAFLANPPSDGYLDRAAGYAAALRAAGLRPQVAPTTYARADAAADAAALLDSDAPPTAVFAHNDQAALGVLDALDARGLAPGRDVSVVGYDASDSSRIPGAPLTTVDVHAVDLGARAAALALRRLAASDAPVVVEVTTPTLVVGATTGPPPATIGG